MSPTQTAPQQAPEDARPDMLKAGEAVAANAAGPAVPAIPAKFRDPKTGELRLEALLKSYAELERKLSSMVDPSDRRRLNQMLGVPEAPEGYQVACDHGLFEPDDAVNRRLHEAGLTAEQVQTVYDVAAEKFVPMILEIAREFEAERELERLEAAFGGKRQWAETCRQMRAWGARHLPAEALEGLSRSYEGVMALHRMMQAGGPAPAMLGGGEGAGAHDPVELKSMVKDPRYWKHKDPAFIEKVADGFRALYGEDEVK